MHTAKPKILIINTAETKGGAAVACNRLHLGLREMGYDSKMLVRHKSSNDESVIVFTESKFKMNFNLFLFYIELFILKFFKRKGVDFSLGRFGAGLYNHPLVKEADVIHIHWTQNSFLSLDDLQKLEKMGKKIIWTLHDMWAFTGGCHYNQSCEKYKTSCHGCPQLQNTSIIDFSKQIFEKKKKIYSKNIEIVTPSVWLGRESMSSALLKNNKHHVIPYNIDFNLFKQKDKAEAKKFFGISAEKKIILFVSMNVDDARKGFQYLKSAILDLEKSDTLFSTKYEILAIGRNNDEIHFKTKVHYTGRLSDFEKISMAYSAADVFVAPSVQDNLPNTVIESLACGTPVVAFNIGGMVDMIDHEQNGYIARFGSEKELANGILYCTSKDLTENCVQSARKKFDTHKNVSQYIELYHVV